MAMFFAEMMVGLLYLIKCKLNPSKEYQFNKGKAKRDVFYIKLGKINRLLNILLDDSSSL
jgi:hypothetical protein